MADLRKVARQKAKKYGLDPNVFGRQINAESGYNPNAVSPAGAIGVAQIMPGTAKGWGVNPHDPVAALDAAAKNMAHYVRQFGSYKNALVAYNAGPGAVGGKLPAETQRYIKNILGGQSPKPLAKAPPAAKAYGKTVAPAPISETKTQIALSLLGMGGLAGSSYGGGDLTSTLLQAAQQQQQTMKPAKGAAPSYGGATGSVKGAVVGSPLAGVKPHGATHPTAGLAGYPAYDYMAKAGTPVVAPVSGKIVKLSGHDPKNGPTNGAHGPFGYSVYVQGNDGHTYFLTHLGSRNVKVGQRVKQGTAIGAIGNYAKWGGADHVHVGVH